jgi:hypothetical protein
MSFKSVAQSLGAPPPSDDLAKKKKKNSNRLKKPKSAFLLWSKEQRQAVRSKALSWRIGELILTTSGVVRKKSVHRCFAVGV